MSDIDAIREREYSSPTANADVATLLAEIDRLTNELTSLDILYSTVARRLLDVVALGNAMSASAATEYPTEREWPTDELLLAVTAWDDEVGR